MKHLFTLTALLISSLAIGQFPNLPYNPDDNADGLIGVADLQTLLANYGQEFSSAVVSEDGESAIIYMGVLGYFECKHSCNQLPGFWSLPSGEDLVPVYSALHASGNNTYTWLNLNDFIEFPYSRVPIYIGNQIAPNRQIEAELIHNNHRCYCAAKQLPRVEYTFCNGPWENTLECAEENTSAGWYPLGDISAEPTPGHFVQAFWRWAE